MRFLCNMISHFMPEQEDFAPEQATESIKC